MAISWHELDFALGYDHRNLEEISEMFTSLKKIDRQLLVKKKLAKAAYKKSERYFNSDNRIYRSLKYLKESVSFRPMQNCEFSRKLQIWKLNANPMAEKTYKTLNQFFRSTVKALDDLISKGFGQQC